MEQKVVMMSLAVLATSKASSGIGLGYSLLYAVHISVPGEEQILGASADGYHY